MSVAETIVRILSRLGMNSEAAAMIRKGSSVEDAYRVANLERKLRRDMRKASRRGARWIDPY